jgi:hypothetical protein
MTVRYGLGSGHEGRTQQVGRPVVAVQCTAWWWRLGPSGCASALLCTVCRRSGPAISSPAPCRLKLKVTTGRRDGARRLGLRARPAEGGGRRDATRADGMPGALALVGKRVHWVARRVAAGWRDWSGSRGESDGRGGWSQRPWACSRADDGGDAGASPAARVSPRGGANGPRHDWVPN